MRAADGLALSSRNRYLSEAERARAPAIHQALRAAVQAIDAGQDDLALLEHDGRAALELAGMRVDYFSVRAAADLAGPRAGDEELIVLTAARLGRARLIDNMRARRGAR